MGLIDTYGDQLVSAFWTTVQLTFWSALGALIWGTILAAMRVSPFRSCGSSRPGTSTSSATRR